MDTKANIKDLNDTIKELEQTTTEMKTIKETFKAIDQLYQEVSATSESYIKEIEILNKVSKNIDLSLENMKDTIKKGQEENNNNYSRTQEIIKKNYDDINKEISNIKDENSKLYRDSQDIVNKALEKNRSDIQIDVRNEGLQIERTFDNSINKNYLELENNLKGNFSQVNDKVTNMDITLKKYSNYLKVQIGFNIIIFITLIIILIVKF